MPENIESPKKVALKETALFLGLWFVGIAVLPVIIYVVGQSIFGEYGETGFSNFYGMLHSEFRAGKPVVWFLMLSPYIAWQLLRLTAFGFRRAAAR